MTTLTKRDDKLRGERIVCTYQKKPSKVTHIKLTSSHRGWRITLKGCVECVIEKEISFYWRIEVSNFGLFCRSLNESLPFVIALDANACRLGRGHAVGQAKMRFNMIRQDTLNSWHWVRRTTPCLMSVYLLTDIFVQPINFSYFLFNPLFGTVNENVIK